MVHLTCLRLQEKEWPEKVNLTFSSDDVDKTSSVFLKQAEKRNSANYSVILIG